MWQPREERGACKLSFGTDHWMADESPEHEANFFMIHTPYNPEPWLGTLDLDHIPPEVASWKPGQNCFAILRFSDGTTTKGAWMRKPVRFDDKDSRSQLVFVGCDEPGIHCPQENRV